MDLLVQCQKTGVPLWDSGDISKTTGVLRQCLSYGYEVEEATLVLKVLCALWTDSIRTRGLLEPHISSPMEATGPTNTVSNSSDISGEQSALLPAIQCITLISTAYPSEEEVHRIGLGILGTILHGLCLTQSVAENSVWVDQQLEIKSNSGIVSYIEASLIHCRQGERFSYNPRILSAAVYCIATVIKPFPRLLDMSFNSIVTVLASMVFEVTTEDIKEEVAACMGDALEVLYQIGLQVPQPTFRIFSSAALRYMTWVDRLWDLLHFYAVRNSHIRVFHVLLLLVILLEESEAADCLLVKLDAASLRTRLDDAISTCAVSLRAVESNALYASQLVVLKSVQSRLSGACISLTGRCNEMREASVLEPLSSSNAAMVTTLEASSEITTLSMSMFKSDPTPTTMSGSWPESDPDATSAFSSGYVPGVTEGSGVASGSVEGEAGSEAPVLDSAEKLVSDFLGVYCLFCLQCFHCNTVTL